MTQTNELICTALEMALRSVDFYRKAKASCADSLGVTMFGQLLADKEQSLSRIQSIQAKLGSGDRWADACPYLPDGHPDVLAAFRRLAATTQAAATACLPEIESLKAAADLEQAGISFYQGRLAQAKDEGEKKFLDFMIGEDRGHFLLVKDMLSYYADPEGYTREAARGSLDGA